MATAQPFGVTAAGPLTGHPPATGTAGFHHVPPDLTAWATPPHLLAIAQAAADRASGQPWLALLQGFPSQSTPDDLLVLATYCYLRGVYPSTDVVQQLESDDTLEAMRPRLGLRAEQVHQFRRARRSALADCLTHALVDLWREHNPGHPDDEPSNSLVRNRHNFGFLEPFYLHARERIERAIALDSMALDE